MRVVQVLCAVVCLAVLAGCFGGQPGEPIKNQPNLPPGQVTLYDRLGGGPVIVAITDKLVDTLLQDPRVNFERLGHEHVWSATPGNIDRLKMYWAQFIGMLCDGPQVYEGRNLVEAHHGMEISQAEWYAFMDDLKKTLDSFQIPEPVEQEVMSRVASTQQTVAGQ